MTNDNWIEMVYLWSSQDVVQDSIKPQEHFSTSWMKNQLEWKNEIAAQTKYSYSRSTIVSSSQTATTMPKSSAHLIRFPKYNRIPSSLALLPGILENNFWTLLFLFFFSYRSTHLCQKTPPSHEMHESLKATDDSSV